MCAQLLNIHVDWGSYFFQGIRLLCSYPVQVSAAGSVLAVKSHPLDLWGKCSHCSENKIFMK